MLPARASLSFSKYARGKAVGAHPVELGLAVLLQGLADHLGREAGLHVLQAFDRVVTILDLRFVLVLERLFSQLLFELGLLNATLQLVALSLNVTDCFGNGELLVKLDTLELGLQLLDFLFLGGGDFVQLVGQKRISKLGGGFLLALGLRECVRERVTLFRPH